MTHTCLLRVAQPQGLGGGELEEEKEGYFPLRANQVQVDAATTILDADDKDSSYLLTYCGPGSVKCFPCIILL